MRKSVFGVMLALGLIAILCLTSLSWAAPRQLKLNTISVTGSPWHKAMLKFSEIIKAKTSGAFEILVYADGQLGNIPQNLTGMQMGTIDMGYFDCGAGSYLKELKAMQIAWCPYLFKSKAEARRILNSQMIAEYRDAAAKQCGVRMFAVAGARSPRAIQTITGPIWKPEQLKGMKMRMPGIPIFVETAKALGAKPTVLPMTEIYMGLKQGMVDGQDNGFDLSIPPKFHEVAKFWSATDHAYSMTGWYIAEKVWQSMSDDQRKTFFDAAMEAGKLADEEMEKLDRESIDILQQAKCAYTIPYREPFRVALKDVYKQFEGDVWPKGWVEKIREMQK